MIILASVLSLTVLINAILELESIQNFQFIAFGYGEQEFDLRDKLFRQFRLKVVEHIGFVEKKITVLRTELDRNVHELIDWPVGREDGFVELFDGRFLGGASFDCDQFCVDVLPGCPIVLVGGVVDIA